MSFPQRPSATAILALLFRIASLVSSQTTISPNHASESPSVYQQYNFTYPTYATDQTILTSYKDSVDVSWTSIAPNHSPSLSIECWIRNATTSPIYASRRPDFASNLTISAPSSEPIYTVDLVTFQDYSPCQFILQDYNLSGASSGSSLPKDYYNPVFSNIFAISVQNRSAGVTWSAENPAPEQTGTDGIGGGTLKSAAKHILPLKHASLVVAILVGLMLCA